jgi:predicted N-acyltransferase
LLLLCISADAAGILRAHDKPLERITLKTMKKTNTYKIRWLNAIREIDQRQWDRLAVPMKSPLMEWQWLHQLEASGSIAPRYGWQPSHLTVWEHQKLIGAAPLYIKTHSEGEFIFDHWWAKLAGGYGINYYPKMIGMSPATPSVGYRFLMDEGVVQHSVMDRMLGAMDQFCEDRKLSCCHLNFVDQPWFDQWPSDHFSVWQHQSYLWRNLGYSTFEDYLKVFKSNQRRNIRRERKKMKTYGIEIQAHTGNEILPEMAETMFHFYLKTNAQYGPWAARYLNADFFNGIFKTYRHRMLILAAYRSPSRHPLAMSMLLVKGRHMIGRYWGCAEPIKDLHFNMCFYAPIQWAIDKGVQTFDPGAGSSHKIYRGFQAVANNSLHRFYDPRLKILFQHLIDDVNKLEISNIEALNRQLPFAKGSRKNNFTF